MDGLRIEEGDRVEVFEGSWAGRVGTVTHEPLPYSDYVWVHFDDMPLKTPPVKVRACTLTDEVVG